MAITNNFYGHWRTTFQLSELITVTVNSAKDKKKYNNNAIIEQILSYDSSKNSYKKH